MSGISSLPIIDLTSFLTPTSTISEKQEIARALYTACHDFGFFYLTGHGIPEELQNGVLEAAREFFMTATQEEKQVLERKEIDEGGDGARGWQRLGENITMGSGDWHEALDYYHPPLSDTSSGPPYDLVQGPNPWPENPAHFRPLYETYIASLHTVGHSLLRAMSLALSPTEDLFTPHLNSPFWCLRAIGYPPLPTTSPGISCGAHTDYGCTTFLLADETRGALEVRDKQGGWIGVDPLKGAYVVNIGDMLEVWTNGLWKSTVHRVVHRGTGFRVSVPFFFEPDWDARVEPLQCCLEKTGGVRKYEAKVYGEHLAERVKGNFYQDLE
ncbi:hypothetical protein DFP73DRAFT_533068 [Morchella snyderi]|nr:hypothetical protein DFP73DRAFT_533068 [Morchella snyderi]